MQSTPDVTLRRMTDGFRRRWLVFALVAGSVIATGVAITFTTRPVYQATVKFPLPPGPPDFTVSEMGGGSGNGQREVASYETTPAQVEALASPSLVSRAIQEGGLASEAGVGTSVIPGLDKESNSLFVMVRGYAARPVAALANTLPVVKAHLERAKSIDVALERDGRNSTTRR